VDIISNIGFNQSAAKSKDVLGHLYEYFLGKLASAEGKGGGEFYTPQSVVQVLVSMLEPFKGCVFDPCCGSGGMFVQSLDFAKAHATDNDNCGSVTFAIYECWSTADKLAATTKRVSAC
jgi:type I restriction enzyme M protein